MGRNSSDDSESPVRARGSTRKRSPSRREKSPGRHKSSYKESSPVREKPSSRTRSSPRHVKSRSPVKPLVREKPSSRTKSPRRAKSPSPSPVSRSPVREKHLSRTRSPGRAKPRSPVARSPVREKPSSQTRSPRHAKSSHSPIGEKPLGRTRSPRRVRSRSPVQLPSEERISNHARSPKRPRSISPSHSPSPRTKRLLRARAGSEAEKVSDKEQKRNHKGSDRSTHREKYSEREEPSARREKFFGKDAIDNGSSRSKRGRSTSPSEHHHISRHRSRSPHNAYDRRDRDEVNNSRGGERGNGTDDSVAKMAAAAEALEKKEKQKPSFELSGKLAEETNRVRGITLLFNEAPDARKPDIRWRLYVLKGGDVLNEPLYVHRQTCYLFGRERRVADIPTDHPSCSKQHAVLQYRQVEKEKDDGTLLKLVRPYLMDLGSTNGTFINDDRIEPQRYYELVEKDTIKFGNSSREYVLLHENSAG